MDKLLEELSKGVVTVVFEKIDTGEIRTMPCSTAKKLCDGTFIRKQDPKGHTFVMYALDKKAWRDVRANTIIEWYKGYPKEKT